jgi:type IV pilus assembly protein PilW
MNVFLIMKPETVRTMKIAHLRTTTGMRGLSLIELMVALIISTLIMMGLTQIFLSTRIVYQADEGLSRLQENGRFALDFIARDIRGAGNMGCLGDIPPEQLADKTTNHLTNKATDPMFDLTRGAIEGFEAVGTGPGSNYSLPALYPATMTSNTTPALDPQLVPNAVGGSDVLVLRKMAEGGVELVPPYTDAAQVFADPANDFQRYQVMMVTDCESAAIFQATTVSNGGGTTNIAHAPGGTPGNDCPNWGQSGCPGRDYSNGGQVSQFRVIAYYIGRGANGGPALFQRSWDMGTPIDTELVEGIESMQILYGVNTDGDSRRNADMYLPANTLPLTSTGRQDSWRIVSVRVGLLVSGSNASQSQASGTDVTGATDTAMDTATYNVAGVTLDPVNDRRWRRVFTTTVEIRNRHQ